MTMRRPHGFAICKSAMSYLVVSSVVHLLLIATPTAGSDITRMVCDCRPLPTNQEAHHAGALLSAMQSHSGNANGNGYNSVDQQSTGGGSQQRIQISASSKEKDEADSEGDETFEKDNTSDDNPQDGNTLLLTGNYRPTQHRSGNDESGNSPALRTIGNDAANAVGGVFVY